jgi:hypothetical protein
MFFVRALVLSASGTRARSDNCEYEHEYYFIDYDYERKPRNRNFKERVELSKDRLKHRFPYGHWLGTISCGLVLGPSS